jgi:hypothetical protein
LNVPPQHLLLAAAGPQFYTPDGRLTLLLLLVLVLVLVLLLLLILLLLESHLLLLLLLEPQPLPQLRQLQQPLMPSLCLLQQLLAPQQPVQHACLPSPLSLLQYLLRSDLAGVAAYHQAPVL